MLKLTLAAVGWLFLVSSCFNTAIKLFGSDADVIRYAGSSRDLDLSIKVACIGLAFISFAAILKKLDQIIVNIEHVFEYEEK